MAYAPQGLMRALRQLQSRVPEQVGAQHALPFLQHLAPDGPAAHERMSFSSTQLPVSLQSVRPFAVNSVDLSLPRTLSAPLLPAQEQDFPMLRAQPLMARSAGYLNASQAKSAASSSASAPILMRGASHYSRYAHMRYPSSPYSTSPSSMPLVREIDLIPHRDWNEEFNQILESPLEKRGNKLEHLSAEFVAVASRIAKIIVRERSKPPASRSVRPIANMGGFAGGEKFRTKGIFFKYAVDQNGLYGSDEGAMKIAGHELRGHTALVSCGMMHGLKFGLMTVLDYQGFRLTATSCLPITQHTLVYGSCDGGHNVLASVPQFNDVMRHCARILNLKGHWAGVERHRQLLHGPCDLEGHVGTDGRWYVVDLARLFPPEAPEASPGGNFLCRLLRPELVKQSEVPLSSDAFTMFGQDGAAEHNQEVRKATRFLLETVIPRLAAHLDATDITSLAQAADTGALCGWVVQELHRAGVNIRHLGLVRDRVTQPALRQVMATELVVRILKNELRGRLRSCPSHDDDEAKKVALEFFNRTFFVGSARRAGLSDAAWEAEQLEAGCFWSAVKQKLAATYARALSVKERQHTDLRQLVDVKVLFDRLQELTGVKFRADVPLAAIARFEASHMEGLIVRAKTMYAVPRIEADAAIELAKTAKDAGEVRRCLETAQEKYNTALQAKPDDHEVLANLGMATSQLAVLEADDKRCRRLFSLAHEKFSAAMGLAPQDHSTMLMWSDAYVSQAVCSMAGHSNYEELLTRALDLLTAAEAAKPGCAHANIARVVALATAAMPQAQVAAM